MHQELSLVVDGGVFYAERRDWFALCLQSVTRMKALPIGNGA